jgi:hypothetical protein
MFDTFLLLLSTVYCTLHMDERPGVSLLANARIYYSAKNVQGRAVMYAKL